TGGGDEGGFAPQLRSNEDALKLIVEAIRKAGYEPGKDVAIALDPASSEFYKDGRYVRKGEGRTLDAAGLVQLYRDWSGRYPIVSIEDGMAEDDWDGWKRLTEAIGDSVQLVGDDLFVTNVERLQEGITRRVANSILIKGNQIGTLTEQLEPITPARRPLAPDLSTASVHVYTDLDDYDAVARGEKPGHYYGRNSNANRDLLERAVAELEGAEAGVATASGMAALHGAILALIPKPA